MTAKFMRCDLHTHTKYSFDSIATMEQYVKQAEKVGVSVICFTDHIDVNKHYNTFDGFQFGKRKEEFAKLKQKYDGKVKLLLGFEIGEPHLHSDVMERVYAEQPDMIIGSVHHPLDYLDVDRHVGRREYEQIYSKCVRAMVEHGGFDVLGHLDLPKKYHDDYVEDVDYVAETLRLCVAKGIVPEINTSSLRNGVATTMPSVEAIKRYASFGGQLVTINSDSHTADTLCYGFDEVKRQLPKQLSVCYFENRKPIKLP